MIDLFLINRLEFSGLSMFMAMSIGEVREREQNLFCLYLNPRSSRLRFLWG